MKKTWIIVITILIVGILMFSITACTSVETETKPNTNTNTNTSMFVQVEGTGNWRVVYHRDTKVMYAVSDGRYNHGTFTLLVNADGTPMTYEANP